MKQKGKLYQLAILLLLALLLSSCGNQGEKAKKIIERTLYEKYGEEFEVYNLGIRNANGDKFYQARIYPKSIIGTSKENDSYYYADATLNIESFGGLAKYAGDTYEEIMMNDEAEEFLLPKAKELFGEFIRIKADIEFQKKAGDFYRRYYESGFQEKREIVKNDPENYRMVVNLYVYIFDRIDDDAEKEKRREEIFQYVQYLKQENLFSLLSLRVSFIDERALASSYEKFREKGEYVEKEVLAIDGNKVYLPVEEFREKMSYVLKKELFNMNYNDKLFNMNKILKEELLLYTQKRYLLYSNQVIILVSSINYLATIYQRGYREAKELGTLKKHYYKTKNDLEFKEENEYIYK